ncbi:MAG: glycine betaine ABC transporter substrate-binding protein [Thermoleophilia bacterium]
MPRPIASTARRLAARALLAALAAALTLGLAACGDDSDDSGAAATGAGTEAAAAAPDRITIGYQLIPNGDLVVKNKKWIEEALPGTAIEWKQFDSGGSVNEAFAAGSLDIGLAGSSPVSRGLSQGISYRVPWIHDVIGTAEALVVKEGITSIADLAGKKVAVPLASTTHYSLLAALRDAGVDPGDVDIIDAEPPDIVAAWTRGDIDAAYVWNPSLAELKADGGTVITDSAEQAKAGHTTYDLAVVSTDFAAKYPAAVTTWVAQQDRAVKLFRSDPADAAAAIAAELNLTPDEALAQAKDLVFLTAAEQAGADYLGGTLGADLFSTATFNKEVGELTGVKAEGDYVAAVVPTFAAAVSGGDAE